MRAFTRVPRVIMGHTPYDIMELGSRVVRGRYTDLYYIQVLYAYPAEHYAVSEVWGEPGGGGENNI